MFRLLRFLLLLLRRVDFRRALYAPFFFSMCCSSGVVVSGSVVNLRLYICISFSSIASAFLTLLFVALVMALLMLFSAYSSHIASSWLSIIFISPRGAWARNCRLGAPHIDRILLFSLCTVFFLSFFLCQGGVGAMFALTFVCLCSAMSFAIANWCCCVFYFLIDCVDAPPAPLGGRGRGGIGGTLAFDYVP